MLHLLLELGRINSFGKWFMRILRFISSRSAYTRGMVARAGSSSTVRRATKFPFRFQRPRIGCLRLSRTLVYLYRRELELAPILLWVAERFIRQYCRKCQARR